jgi:hypothetical protein
MSHFAEVINGIVQRVIVAEQSFIDKNMDNPEQWIQTSYNTRHGVYYTPNTITPDPDQSKAFRKNFAEPNGTYDEELDAFLPPKPFPSWVLEDWDWKAPTPYPWDENKPFIWNEDELRWEEI